MKMTFAIPDTVGRRFRKIVPAGDRSAVVANLIRKKLRQSQVPIEAACHRVNRLGVLQREMAEWEPFDDYPA